MTKTLITLCTYNECENIAQLIPELHTVAPDATILVIDDNSPPTVRGNWQIDCPQRTPEFRHCIAPGNWDWEPRHLPDFVTPSTMNSTLLSTWMLILVTRRSTFLDSSNECRTATSPLLLAMFPVVASPGGTVGRKLMSQSINLWARLCLGLSTQDNSGSFRCYRVSKLAEIDWTLTMAKGYAFQEEVLYRCHRVGCRMTESPFIFEDRRFGTTKINLSECPHRWLGHLRPRISASVTIPCQTTKRRILVLRIARIYDSKC
jgi:dolichol-phosphate mannosyltransferase